jgi:hypothetical protein
MQAIIDELERIKQEIIKEDFTPERSLQVDRLDTVIDFLKEKQK